MLAGLLTLPQSEFDEYSDVLEDHTDHTCIIRIDPNEVSIVTLTLVKTSFCSSRTWTLNGSLTSIIVNLRSHQRAPHNFDWNKNSSPCLPVESSWGSHAFCHHLEVPQAPSCVTENGYLVLQRRKWSNESSSRRRVWRTPLFESILRAFRYKHAVEASIRRHLRMQHHISC